MRMRSFIRRRFRRATPKLMPPASAEFRLSRALRCSANCWRFKQGIAVAGTHGKTTITSMVAAVLGEAGMDPTCIVGGRLLAHGANARLGAGEHIIAEADESDASFLHLRPVIAVVSNIDDDHLDAYGQNPAELRRAFAAFLENLPFYGVAVLCFDDAAARECADGLAKRICSYAISADADYRADSIKSEGDSQRFILRSESLSGEFILRAKGRHNVQNALAAIAVGEELGAPENAIRKALAEFSGVGRRLEEIGECKIGGAGILLIDDYGHHPTEICGVAFGLARILFGSSAGFNFSAASLHADARHL